MSKYFLFLFSLFFLISCSDTTSVQKPIIPQDQNTIPVVSPVSSQTGTDITTRQKANIQKAQQKQYTTFMQTALENCDSPEFKKTNEAVLRAQNTASGRIDIILASAPERCKIRAIIRDNLNCSLLTETKSIERCEYSKKAVQEVEEFKEKQAIYERLFGSISKPIGRQSSSTLFSDWW